MRLKDQHHAEWKRWQRERFRAYERLRAREQVGPRMLLLAFILCVMALAMAHVSAHY
jgi:hypothetical protein